MIKFLYLGRQRANPFTYHYLTDPQSKLTPSQRQWTKQMINITIPAAIAVNSALRVVFQLISRVPSTYLAIDDITYQTGLCTTASPTPPPLSTTPPTMDPSLTLLCDFESGSTCNWKNNPSNLWVVANFASFLTHPGDYIPMLPKVDHTKKNNEGYYAYVQHSSMNLDKSKKAFMSIIDYGVAGSGIAVCFRLWYYMKTTGYSRLNVTITSPGNSVVARATREYGQGEQWNQLQLEVQEHQLDHMSSYNFSISAEVNFGE